MKYDVENVQFRDKDVTNQGLKPTTGVNIRRCGSRSIGVCRTNERPIG